MRHPMAILSILVFVAPAASQDWGQTHAQPDLNRFVDQQGAGHPRVSASAIYRAARSKGWLRRAADRQELKRQLKAVARENGHGRILRRAPKPRGLPGGGVVTSLMGEVEFNDSEGYANDLGALVVPLSATGTLATADDVDAFRFNVPLAGEITVRTTFSGLAPDLILTNARGDEVWGHHFYGPNFTVALPAGTYHLRVGNAAGTTYTVDLAIQIGALTSLSMSGQVIVTAGDNPAAVTFDTTAEGRVRIELSASVATSTMIVLQSSDWSYIYESAVDSQSTSGAAGLDVHLPVGRYYAYIFAGQTSSVSVSANFTAAAVPVLTTTATGSLAGSQESYDLYRVVVTQEGMYRFTLSGSGSSPMSDTYLRIYDQGMVQILEGDDRSVDTLSDLSIYLPVGSYYVSSDSFWESGGYAISMASRSGSTVTARAGSNAGSVVGNGTRAYRFSLGTESRLEFVLIDGTTDGQIGVLDAATGRALAWEDDENLGPQDAVLGMVLPAGDYLVFVRDYTGQAGTFALNVLPPLHRLPGDNAVLRGNGGSLVYMLASTMGAAPSNPLPGIVSGSLLLDLSSGVVVPLVLGGSGVFDFRFNLPMGGGWFVQGVEVDVGSGLGVYLNLLQ